MCSAQSNTAFVALRMWLIQLDCQSIIFRVDSETAKNMNLDLRSNLNSVTWPPDLMNFNLHWLYKKLQFWPLVPANYPHPRNLGRNMWLILLTLVKSQINTAAGSVWWNNSNNCVVQTIKPNENKSQWNLQHLVLHNRQHVLELYIVE